MSWKYLQFFMEDDNKLKEIGEQYGSGSMLTGEIKAELIKVMRCTLCLCLSLSHVRRVVMALLTE